MRPAHSNILLLALLLANASAILFFRFFTSVDGPIHVLHASLLEWPWTTVDHQAQGITYDSRTVHDWFGHRILMVLLLFRTPLQAHDLFAALVCCTVVFSVVAYLSAHGTRMGLAILWLVPITFNVLLVIGLFHFLLGVAVAFGSVAWWKWYAGSPRVRWPGLLFGAVLAGYTHRAAPILLGILFLLTLFVGPRTTRSSLIWGIVFLGALVLGALRLGPLLLSAFQMIPDELPDLGPSIVLRPFFLLDQAEGAWPIHGIGLLLLVSFTIGVWARWRMERKAIWHDALLMLFVCLTFISWIYGKPIGHQIFIAERCQWLAILTLVLWLTAIADISSNWVARSIGGAALCAMPLHIIRLVNAEDHFARLRPGYALTVEACDALKPGSLVVPVLTDPDPLLQHLEAYVAIEHSGILIAPDEHLRMVLPATLERSAPWLHTEDPAWLIRRWRKGIPPEVDEILFIGSDIEQVLVRHPWPSLLGDRFMRRFKNDHAQIYTASPAK